MFSPRLQCLPDEAGGIRSVCGFAPAACAVSRNCGSARTVFRAGTMNGECILVLEDDPGNARLQKLCLERAGYQVRTAHTTASAFKTLRETAVDLITVDYKLEDEITGLGFCA